MRGIKAQGGRRAVIFMIATGLLIALGACHHYPGGYGYGGGPGYGYRGGPGYHHGYGWKGHRGHGGYGSPYYRH